MSSWKKASKVNQKVHRERHQPEKRAELGFLEKHKDYVRRARDYQRKKNVIKKLKEAALNRNPDEFYFHMVNSQVVDGLHIDKKKPLSEDTVEQKKLIENRSLSYVSMKYNIEQKKVEKLKSELHAIDFTQKIKSKHLFFGDEKEKGTKKKRREANDEIEDLYLDEKYSKLKLVQHTNVHPALIDNRSNRLRMVDLAKMELPDVTFNDCRNMHRIKLKRYKELAKRIDRKKQLAIIRRKIEIQQCLKGTKKVEKPKLIKQGSRTSAAVYEWKYERKR